MSKREHGGDVYRHKNVIDFSSNSNPYGPPEGVVEAIRRAAADIGRYPDTLCVELKRAIGKKLGVPQEELFIGNGAAEVLFALAQALRPQEALVTAPAFAEYEASLIAAGCKCRRYQLREEEAFRIREDLLEEIGPELDVLYLCNPANPTGAVTEKSFLLRVLETCRENQVRLVLDECFLDFTEDPEGLTLLHQVAGCGQLIILKAFTKLYAMAGARLGYCVCSDPEVIRSLEEVVQPWNVSSLAQAAGIAALKEDAFVADSLKKLRKSKQLLIQELEDLGIHPVPSGGNFLFFKSDPDLYQQLLDRGILIRDCSNYEGLTADWYRIAVRTEEENERLIRAMKEILWQKRS